MNKHLLLHYVSCGRNVHKTEDILDKITLAAGRGVIGYRDGASVYEIMEDWDGEYSIDRCVSYEVFYPNIVYVKE